MERTRNGVALPRRSSPPTTASRSRRTGEPNDTRANSVYAPPSNPRDPDAPTPADLRSLLAAFLLAAVIPAGLFVASRPLVGTAGLATLAVLVVVARRLPTTARRLRHGRPLRFDLPGGVRLRVVRRPVEPRREETSPREETLAD